MIDSRPTIKIDASLLKKLRILKAKLKIGSIKHFVDQAIIEKLKNEKL